MSNKKLINEISRMQELAGIISENKQMLNEDILELKQMSKQLYTFLKGKGMPATLITKLNLIRPDSDLAIGDRNNSKAPAAAQIVVDPQNQVVTIAISSFTVAYVLSGGGNDWIYAAYKKFGQDTNAWFRNAEIKSYVDKLGNELSQQLKAKYPNMLYKFRTQEGFWYIMDYGYGQTKKGGQLDPNKVKKPVPQQQAAPLQQPPAQAAE